MSALPSSHRTAALWGVIASHLLCPEGWGGSGGQAESRVSEGGAARLLSDWTGVSIKAEWVGGDPRGGEKGMSRWGGH